LCHELAHNSCGLHDAAFAHALELILVESAGEFYRMVDRRGLQLP